jgi:endonuclease YncB( thermonuclease family)
MRRKNGAMAVLALVLIAAGAHAETGAIGGTVVQGNTTFRLWGIYVAAPGQVCEDGWTVGQAAADGLARLTRGRSVVCDPRGDSRASPRPAVCKVDDKDLAAEMVRAGLAWALLSDGTTYVVAEADALRLLFGVHAHICRIARERTLEQYSRP